MKFLATQFDKYKSGLIAHLVFPFPDIESGRYFFQCIRALCFQNSREFHILITTNINRVNLVKNLIFGTLSLHEK